MMTDLPDFVVRGERARLFPVLADTSREGRTLSIFLSCFETVDDFGRALLGTLGHKFGPRSRVETFTEVVLKKTGTNANVRPDGLISVTTGDKKWHALVEAKVANSELTSPQIEAYLDLAKLNGIDALITLSNQFAPLPAHHPLNLSASSRRKAELFHWSWMHVVTHATLQLGNDEIVDREQRVILREMNRFLLHPSSGVKGYDQMPAAWNDLVAKVLAGGVVSPSSQEVRDVVDAWHQEVGDLSLTLSRQLETPVKVWMSRAHAADPSARRKSDQKTLADVAQLNTILDVPDAAGSIDVCADLKKRSVAVGMKVRAPDEPKSAKARLNWLLKQLAKSNQSGIHIRCFWPGGTRFTQHSLETLRTNPGLAVVDRVGQSLLSFEILLVKDLGNRFSQRRNFIVDLESAVSEFYGQVAEHVKAWQARAPKLRDDKAEPADVGTTALREEVEQDALSGEA